MSISPDVVIMTQADLNRHKEEYFRRGVERGKFETRSQETAEIAALREQNRQLVETLRRYARFRTNEYADGNAQCAECGGRWWNDAPEQHAAGCLAAPRAEEVIS